ncbi:DUF3368 domain-containing protein [Chroogloeocystis siderophila]|uniref:DUF3368 domain-containing protein n=1 Tax=Chroogloeocystis siderophila TaxID=329163 RepID=UPI0015BAA481|nr:DUF3368 domain-containing protein [Chroogloeocystis siderophila]
MRQLYGVIIIPTAVYNEMVNVGKIVPGAAEVKTLPWIQTQTVTDAQRVKDTQTKQSNIDLGEAEAIILTLELKANLLLMDERRGRVLAADLGLNVTGLLGVLLQAKRNGLILSVKPLMDHLIEQVDFRVSSQLYATILQAAGE